MGGIYFGQSDILTSHNILIIMIFDVPKQFWLNIDSLSIQVNSSAINTIPTYCCISNVHKNKCTTV